MWDFFYKQRSLRSVNKTTISTLNIRSRGCRIYVDLFSLSPWI